MKIKSFYHPTTYTLTYIAYDENSKDAVIIDSVLDYDNKGSTIGVKSADILLDFVRSHDLNVHFLLETHAHADHLSAASYLKKSLPNAKTAIGSGITEVQKIFKGLFQVDNDITGADFDELLDDGQIIKAGSIEIKAISTPGHTPACMTFVANDKAAFTGDLMFSPDGGTGRCDFPGGSSGSMYDSIANKVYKLPEDLRLYPSHDYQPGGRVVWDNASLKEHREANIHITKETSQEQFQNFRDGRDSGLAAPALLLQSVQFNAWAGKLFNEEAPLLHIPLRITER
jgi:glyoxylase-like metal-dependent hydrolase (beta-lactamase superfamily II)